MDGSFEGYEGMGWGGMLTMRGGEKGQKRSFLGSNWTNCGQKAVNLRVKVGNEYMKVCGNDWGIISDRYLR